MSGITSTLTVAGTTYEAELARVARAHLGYEDHGLLSINLELEGIDKGWGQSTGHRSISEPKWMHLWVKLFVDFFGEWGQIQGKECWVLRESYASPILGLADKSGSKVIIFADEIAKAREEVTA